MVARSAESGDCKGRLLLTAAGEEHPEGHGVVHDADQVGGEGQGGRLRVGGEVHVEEQQRKQQQVQVEVEALN